MFHLLLNPAASEATTEVVKNLPSLGSPPQRS